MAFAQVESAFPVFNVLLHEGNLVFSAGRHWGMHGGIHLYGLDPATGALRWHTRVIRGLSTDKLTPEHCRFGQPRN